jgi:hypothetical protein
MSTTIVVPAPFVVTVRAALLSSLGGVASNIGNITTLRGHESRADWFSQPLLDFDAYRAAVEATGWQPLNVEVGSEHRWALSTALAARLLIARHLMDVETQIPGAQKQRRRAAQSASEIEAFIAETRLTEERR